MTSSIYSHVARRVREERRRLGWTLERLASEAGISTGFLAYIEKNRKKASLETIERLAHALGLSASELLRDCAAPRGESDKELRTVSSMMRESSPRKRAMIYKVIKAMTRS